MFYLVAPAHSLISTTMPLSQNIFLIGMPGAGKSTVGKLLAKIFARTFLDTDDEIVRRNGVEIATIFEIEGEDGFRQREVGVIDELTRQSGIVLATGGGAILRAENRQVLAERGVVVYLCANIDVLVQRTTQDSGKRKKRPLLDNIDVRERLVSLLAIREPLYNQIAHLKVDANMTTRSRFVQKLAADIAEFIAKRDVAEKLQPQKSNPTSNT
ncbi:MAG: shikimate kinase [Pseudomonadota bacterium]